MAQSQKDASRKGLKETPTGEFLTPRQLARMLGVASYTLMNWRNRSRCGPPFVKVTRMTVRYPLEGVRTWVQAKLDKAAS